MDDVRGRVVVITGAGGGVGRTVTRRWLEAGASVLAVGSSARSLDALGEHANLERFAADLTQEAGARGAVEAAREAFGAPDTLLHLVGGFTMGPIDADAGARDWDRMLAVNATSAFHAFRAMVPALRERGGGWLVGLGSRAADAPAAQMAAYAASKAALAALVKSTALELRPENIHVNLILASTIDTAANREAMGEKPAATWVTPEDVADATFFLCSERAKSVHGATLELYGLA